MLNPNVITARLSRLHDSQLQQYVAMHKNDPYIVALGVSEANRRKQMREAVTPMPGQGQEPPKVVDQALQGMAPPEAQGIAALPAEGMEFADGGIVGYAAGEEVVEGSRTSYNPLRYMPGLNLASDEGIARGKQYLGWLLGQNGLAAPKETPGVKLQRETDAEYAKKAPPNPYTYSTPEGQFVGPAESPAAAKPAAGLPAAAQAKASKAGSTGAKTAGLGSIAPQGESDDIKALRKIMSEQRDTPEPSFKVFDEEQTKRKDSIKGKANDNIDMALINAGLAMMSTKRADALGGIGEGAQAGVKSYLEGKKSMEEIERDISKAEVAKEQALNDNNMKKYEAAAKRLQTSMKGYEVIIGAQHNAAKLASDERQHAETQATQRAVANTYAARGAAGAGSKEMQEYGDLQVKVMASLDKNPRFQMASEDVQRQMYENALRMAVQSNPFLKGHAAPAAGSAGWGIKEIK